MADYIPYLQNQIETQRKAIISFKWWFWGLLVFGIGIFFLTFFIKFENDIIANVTKLGGGLISVVSALPFSQILTRREKLNKYDWLKSNLKALRNKKSKDYNTVEQIIIDDMKKI